MASSVKVSNLNYNSKPSFMRNSHNIIDGNSRLKTPYDMIQFTQSVSPKKHIKDVKQ